MNANLISARDGVANRNFILGSGYFLLFDWLFSEKVELVLCKHNLSYRRGLGNNYMVTAVQPR